MDSLYVRELEVKGNSKFLFWASGRIELSSIDIGKTMVEQLLGKRKKPPQNKNKYLVIDCYISDIY